MKVALETESVGTKEDDGPAVEVGLAVVELPEGDSPSLTKVKDRQPSGASAL